MGKLHQMHLLGNGAQRELLTSLLLKQRRNYRSFQFPDLMIILRYNDIFLIMCVSAGREIRAQ